MSLTIPELLNRKIRHFTNYAFEGVETLNHWEAIRAERYRELMQNFGLDPMPSREGLRCEELGTGEGQGFRTRKVAFELARDAWSSATIYYPANASARPAPGVLYVCGHAANGAFHYQAHAQMWARRGYVCLLVETLEQGDHHGEHHSYLCHHQERWIALGYTAAGGELWNSLRALDVLSADPAVDPERLGATGISGGGALSFFLAMTDERVKAVGSMCGISTPQDAVVKARHVWHCDCMYPANLYGRELAEYAALIAPRAAVYCFGDRDPLFTPSETAAFVARARTVYSLYDVPEKCVMVTHDCGHTPHPVFNKAVQQWFDREVAGEEHPLVPLGERELTEVETTVWNGASFEPDLTRFLPDLLSPRGQVALPHSPEEAAALRQSVLKGLPYGPTEPFQIEWANGWQEGEVVYRSYLGTIAEVESAMHLIGKATSKRLLVTLAKGDQVMQETMTDVGGVLDDGFVVVAEGRLSAGRFPEAVPIERRLPVPGLHNRALRIMRLAGEHPIRMMISDLQAMLDRLLEEPWAEGLEVYLHGRGDQAVAALYQGLRDDRVAGVILADLPHSHADRASLPGILRQLDVPQAVGLMAPRKVALIEAAHGNWNWLDRAYGRLGATAQLLRVQTVKQAFAAWDRPA